MISVKHSPDIDYSLPTYNSSWTCYTLRKVEDFRHRRFILRRIYSITSNISPVGLLLRKKRVTAALSVILCLSKWSMTPTLSYQCVLVYWFNPGNRPDMTEMLLNVDCNVKHQNRVKTSNFGRTCKIGHFSTSPDKTSCSRLTTN